MPTDPIKHVVVLMLENHSFDQMLGSFRAVFPDLEGVDPANPGSNRDKDGMAYSQAVTTATAVQHDPMHELANVLHQLENNNGNFVLDYSEAYPGTTPDERQQIMGYLRRLAPGPSRTGSALHDLRPLVFLGARADLGESLLRPQRHVPGPGANARRPERQPAPPWPLLRLRPRHDLRPAERARRSLAHLPRRHSAIPGLEPPAHGSERPAVRVHGRVFQRCQGPGGTVPGLLLHRAVATTGPARTTTTRRTRRCVPRLSWAASTTPCARTTGSGTRRSWWCSTTSMAASTTMLPPPAAVPPDGHTLPNFGFDRLGVRVPASAGLAVGRADGHQDRVRPHQPAQVPDREVESRSVDGASGRRKVSARPFGRPASLERTRRVPCRFQRLAAAPEAMMAAGPGEPLNGHQKALIAFSEYLEREIEEPVGKPARTAAMMAGPPSQVETAKSRVEMFLAQQKAKAGQP